MQQEKKKVYGCKHASRLLLEEFMFIFLLDFTVGQIPNESFYKRAKEGANAV